MLILTLQAMLWLKFIYVKCMNKFQKEKQHVCFYIYVLSLMLQLKDPIFLYFCYFMIKM